MQSIQPIQFDTLGDATKLLLAAASAETGVSSNMIKTLAQSPRVLEGYMQFSRALAGGVLDPKIREQIALVVAQENLCEYSLAYHTSLARKLGLTDDQIMASREGRTPDRKTTAILAFVRDLVSENGDCSTAELHRAGFSEGEIVDIIALASVNVFENYFNLVARTEIDFPKVRLRLKAA